MPEYYTLTLGKCLPGRTDPHWLVVGCCTSESGSVHLHHRKPCTHSSPARDPNYHPLDRCLCCTSGSVCQLQHRLDPHWLVGDCHMSYTCASDLHYTSGYSSPSCSRGPSYHGWDRVRCYRSRCGHRCLHTGAPRTVVRGWHTLGFSDVSLHRTTRCRLPSSPTMSTSHPLGSVSPCTLGSVCPVPRSAGHQMKEGGCCTASVGSVCLCHKSRCMDPKATRLPNYQQQDRV